LTAVLAYLAGTTIEKRFRVDDAVGAVAVHGVSGFLGVLWVGIFAAGYPTGLENLDSSLGGQLMGIMTFFPLGFLPGYLIALAMRKLNILRVPPEVELEGLDIAEFQLDFYPEFERVDEVIVMPDGETVPAGDVLLESHSQVRR
jgi:ammonia channel protein AmtB